MNGVTMSAGKQKSKELEPVAAKKKRPSSAGKFTSLWDEPGKLRKINFVVATSSSEDDGYPAAGLNYQAPDARGWQSARFCLYPQTLVLRLEEKVCVRRLQFLSHSIFIPETMEVEVGDVPPGLDVDLENASFAKVGTVAFDTNEKSEYKAREFKTVNMEALGTFVKLVVHKNYDNRLNKFNQVGLLGINIIGHGPDEEFKPQEPNQQPSNRGVSASENLSIGMDKDLTSAYDDLAYNMYMDPEVVELGRKLERRKQVAVRVERYEYARKLKNAQTALKLVGLKMGSMEMEKRIYMDNGQYDKAKARAKQKAELRDEAYAKLEIDTLLETNGPNPKNDELETKELAPAKKKKEKPKSPEPPPIKEEAPKPPQQPLPPTRTAPVPPPLPPKPAFMREMNDSNNGHDRIYLTQDMRDNMVQSPEPRDPSPPPLPPKTPKMMREPSPPITLSEPDPDPDPEPEEDAGIGDEEEEEEDVEPEPEPEPEPPVEERRLPTRYQSYDDRRVTGLGGRVVPIPNTKSYSRGPDLEMDRAIGKLTEAQKKEAALPIEVFGIKTISKVYDKQFNNKEVGFKEVKSYIESYKYEKGKPKAGDVMKASTMMLQKALKDNVLGIFFIGTDIMGTLYGPFLDRNTITKNDLAVSLDKIYPDVSSKLASTVPRQQSLAQQAILQAAEHPQVAATGVISRALTKPFPKNAHSQGGLCRAEMVEQLMDGLGVQKAKDSGLSAGELMAFASSGIQQPTEAIRKPCERIYVRLYKSHPKLVKKYLPMDEDSAKRNPSHRTLLAEFKQIDEQGQGGGSTKNSADLLPPAQFEDRDISRRNSYRSPMPMPKKSVQEEEATCIFCGESSPEFVGKNVNVHYWKSCPMLSLCENCKQVIEVSALPAHLLGECPASHRYKRCQYCGEAVKKKEYDSHVQIKPHPIAPPATQGNHCSLCHQNIGPWEEGWRAHLLGPNSCPAHDRKPNQAIKYKNKDADVFSPPGSGALSVDSGYTAGRTSRFPSISSSETASVSSHRSSTSMTKYSSVYGTKNLPKIEPAPQRQRHQSEGPPTSRKTATTGPTGVKAPQRSVSEAPTARKRSKPWDRRTAW